MPTATAQQADSGDRAVLVALYNATGGANWTNNTNWLSDAPISEWPVVAADSDGDVIDLSSVENDSNGPIPAELGNLANLVNLDPGGSNQFTGSIPDASQDVATKDLSEINLPFSSAVLTDPGRDDLDQPIRPPMAPAYMDWRWEGGQDGFREVTTDFTIHNDVGDFSDQHGFYLILMQNSISDVGFYFGLQTDANGRGKGLTFSRWKTRDLANAKHDDTYGWTESSGHEGDFIGVRRSYEWSAGDYRIRVDPDGLARDGEWFGLWITDLNTGVTSWIGSLKFPLSDGTAVIEPRSSATIELYGVEPIRPIDVPQWHVSVKRPLGDGVPSTWGYTSYPFDDSENALPNSDVLYDSPEDAAHLHVGGTTERVTPATARIDFEPMPASGTPPPGAHPDDFAALVALYNATDGANWTNNSNWLSDRPLREWHGVRTEGNGPVTGLYLNDNQLSGEIPPELGGLSNLEELVLYQNRLSGEIPAKLGSLANLERLELQGNQLSGEIPAELGSLANLEWLGLSFNQLSGEIPAELGSLSNLEVLELHRNRLSGPVPTWLGSLANLRGLDLQGNQLSGEIPAELGSLSSLEWLALSSNRLSGEIPPELGSLSNLESLYLSGNQLSGEIPSELGSLSNLRQLWLHDNSSLSGPLPGSFTGLTSLTILWLGGTQLCVPTDAAFQAWLGGIGNRRGVVNCLELTDRAVLVALYNATGGGSWNVNDNWLSDAPLGKWHGVTVDEYGRVVWLDLQGNQLSGEIPPELGNLAFLEYLNLGYNNWGGGGNDLTGEIPPELGDLSSLEYLDLSGNQLTGEVPPELGNLSSLVRMSLSRNQLSGEIPPELGNLARLEWMSLSGNQLSGEIPPELGNLARLGSLDLQGNQLSGEIPPELGLGSLAFLGWMSLSGNQLSGEIPPELGNLTRLGSLGLRYNQLTGEIPPELGSLAFLETLYLSGNQLTGEIPPELGNLTRLGSLHLNETQLSGEIPPELGSLTSLETLYLNETQLSGEIPPELGNLTSLETLWLYENQLTGEIPPELGNLTSLGSLYLYENQLTGEIPPELGNLTSLGSLYLYENQLTGEIPPELGNLTNLRSLNLSYNQLTGEIPPELGNLTNLGWLDLSYNQLTGEIPPELGNLTSLRWLNLSYNQLTGCIPDGLRKATLVRPVPVLGFCPGAPKGLTAVASGTGAAVNLSWTAPAFTGASHITGYRIQASPDGNDPWTDVPTSILGNVTAYTDDGADEDGPRFAAGEWLHYRVAAVNLVGTGPFSEPVPSVDPLIFRYDTNANGTIDRSEVIAAINDYLFGGEGETISRADVIRLITLYLFG